MHQLPLGWLVWKLDSSTQFHTRLLGFVSFWSSLCPKMWLKECRDLLILRCVTDYQCKAECLYTCSKTRSGPIWGLSLVSIDSLYLIQGLWFLEHRLGPEERQAFLQRAQSRLSRVCHQSKPSQMRYSLEQLLLHQGFKHIPQVEASLNPSQSSTSQFHSMKQS